MLHSLICFFVLDANFSIWNNPTERGTSLETADQFKIKNTNRMNEIKNLKIQLSDKGKNYEFLKNCTVKTYKKQVDGKRELSEATSGQFLNEILLENTRNAVQYRIYKNQMEELEVEIKSLSSKLEELQRQVDMD